MKPILVHLHIFYHELWPEFREKLSILESYPYDLHVTLTKENEDLQQEILTIKQDAHIHILENRGYDIWPFIYVLNQANLKDYSYIVKLHTKKNIVKPDIFVNKFPMRGNAWRKSLFGFIENKEVFKKHIQFMEENHDIDMLSNYKMIVSDQNSSRKTRKMLSDFFDEYGIEKRKYTFVAGTMFLARASVFKQLKALSFTEEQFEKGASSGHHTLAHKIERLMGLLVWNNNSKIIDIVTPKHKQYINFFFHTTKRFFFQTSTTTSDKHLIKICKIPVYSRRKFPKSNT